MAGNPDQQEDTLDEQYQEEGDDEVGKQMQTHTHSPKNKKINIICSLIGMAFSSRLKMSRLKIRSMRRCEKKEETRIMKRMQNRYKIFRICGCSGEVCWKLYILKITVMTVKKCPFIPVLYSLYIYFKSVYYYYYYFFFFGRNLFSKVALKWSNTVVNTISKVTINTMIMIQTKDLLIFLFIKVFW